MILPKQSPPVIRTRFLPCRKWNDHIDWGNVRFVWDFSRQSGPFFRVEKKADPPRR